MAVRDSRHQMRVMNITLCVDVSPEPDHRGNCWDNPPMENFFGHLKEEALRHFPTPNFEQARQMIDDYVHFYNYERIQLKTRQTPYKTPSVTTIVALPHFP
jgi:transposase InsO family protein